MAPPLLTLNDARLTFGGRPTFAGVTVALGRGDRACLVGRNGSGKSTLLRVLAGLIDLDSGERFQQPGARVAYMPQEPVFDPTLTAAQFVAQGLAHDPHDGEPSHLIEAVLDEAEVAPDRLLANLSGGEGRRISLAAALVAEPDILLLDEPTNHLDIPAIEWLEERMLGFSGGILMVSHDRAFLNRLSRRTLWLDRGALRQTDRGFAAFDEWSATVLADEEAERRRIDRRIISETSWLRDGGISGRRRRNQGRLARLEQMRRERSQRVTLGTAKIGPTSAESGGKIVFEAENVAKSFVTATGSKTIARKFSTRILRGDRVGVIGRNGSGKTTLLGMLTGAIPPDAGSVRQGTNLLTAIFDQNRASLDPEATPWTTLAGDSGETVMVQGKPKHVASYLKDFLFEDRQYRAKVSALSGGERNRLLLAKILAQPSNLLILDEPTNDLDMETLDLLEEILADYDGTLLLVSHDRDFLDRLVTSVIAVEGDGVVDEYVGGYTDYLRQRRPNASRPAAKTSAKPAAKPRETAPAKLGFKEQRELDQLPKRIAALERDRATLDAKLADPELYARGRAEFAAATERHTEIEQELAAAEERWLALAEKAEALTRGKV